MDSYITKAFFSLGSPKVFIKKVFKQLRTPNLSRQKGIFLGYYVFVVTKLEMIYDRRKLYYEQK